MPTLDPRFYCSSDIESVYVYKDTGEPLALGELNFYEDENRTVRKLVYQLTGAPGSYTFTPLENPLFLGMDGTPEDEAGNKIVFYYFPFEGIPAASSGQKELYYVTVHSAEGVLQETRQAWPPAASNSGEEDAQDNINFIPNGQFLVYNDWIDSAQPPSETFANIIAQPIAQGGWLFLRSVGGSSTFNISFEEITTTVSGLNDYPRNALIFECTSFNASDTVRDIAISWFDVNKFSAGNPAGTQPYTLFTAIESIDSNSYVFDVRLIRYFGSGGTPSPLSDTSIGSFTVTPSFSYFTLNINGIEGDTGVLGTDGRDRILITIRGPSSTWGIKTTDWAFMDGTLDLTAFPTMTNAQMLTTSLMGWVEKPQPRGSDLGLPPVLTLQGMRWDASEVGDIVQFPVLKNYTGSVSDTSNRILCDGNAYPYAGYSHLGIPYSRLGDYLWDETNNIFVCGSGYDFATCYVSPTDDTGIYIVTNKNLTQANASDGSAATGFTFALVSGGFNGAMLANRTNRTGGILMMSMTPMQLSSDDYATAGDSNLTVEQIYPQPTNEINTGLTLATVYQLISIVVTEVPVASTYFTYTDTVGNPIYGWFIVDGVGTDPAIPGAAPVTIRINSGFSLNQIASIIRDTISGFCSTYIVCQAASTLTAGDFWQFEANDTTYYVTYIIDGVGTATVGGTPIYVNVDSSDTADVVAEKTQIAINKYQFAVPNLIGCFLRGIPAIPNLAPANTIGMSTSSLVNRFMLNDIPTSYGGQYEFSDNIAHSHEYVPGDQVSGNEGSLTNTLTTPFTDPGLAAYLYTQSSGAVESRPFNFGVYFAIKY